MMESGTYESFTVADLRRPLRILLVTAEYVPDYVNHVRVKEDVAPFEPKGGSYAAGPKTLPDSRYDSETMTLYAAPAAWPRGDFSARAVVLATEDGRLVACSDLGSDVRDKPDVSPDKPLVISWRDGVVLNLKVY